MRSKFCALAALMPFALAADVVCSFPQEEPFVPSTQIKTAQVQYLNEDSVPVIDGKLDDAAWNKATKLDPFVWLRRLGMVKLQAFANQEIAEQKRIPVSQNTEVKIGYDQQNLYVAFNCKEARMNELRTKEADGSVYVWMDDCVELMLQPPDAPKDTYWLIVVTAGNARLTSWSYLKGVTAKSIAFTSAVQRNKDNWTVEVKIPFASLGTGVPQDGSTWRANFGREEQPFGEFSSWCETLETFNEPQHFGRIYFGKNQTPEISSVNWDNPAAGSNKLTADLFNPANKEQKINLVLKLDGKVIAQQETVLQGGTYTKVEMGYKLPETKGALELSCGGEVQKFAVKPRKITGIFDSNELLNPAEFITGSLELPIGNSEFSNVKLIWQLNGKEIGTTTALKGRKLKFEAALPELSPGKYTLKVIVLQGDKQVDALDMPFSILPGMFDEV
ncbi:MAG: hypothetical protein E7056_04375 [Lentisphaerae bacterium]|nr:hypothetical protein [Lentisphaerota bacterium]